MYHWHGGLCGHLGRAIHIAVKAIAHLFAQHAPRQPLRGDDAGAKTWLLVILVVDRLHDGVRHVQGRQVHQLKRPELETHLVAQDAVNGGEVGHALTDDAQCLGAETTPCVVDDKARRVLRLHGGVPHFAGVGREGLAQGRSSLEACYHLHHFHQRHGVEEVKTRQPLRLLQARGNGRD